MSSRPSDWQHSSRESTQSPAPLDDAHRPSQAESTEIIEPNPALGFFAIDFDNFFSNEPILYRRSPLPEPEHQELEDEFWQHVAAFEAHEEDLEGVPRIESNQPFSPPWPGYLGCDICALIPIKCQGFEKIGQNGCDLCHWNEMECSMNSNKYLGRDPTTEADPLYVLEGAK